MKISKKLMILIIGLFLMCTANLRAFAGDVTIDFTAVVDYIQDQFCQCISDDEVAIGDTLYGYYIFNEAVSDLDTSSSSGWYQMAEDPYEIFMTNNNVSFYSKPNESNIWIHIKDNDGSPQIDTYSLFSYQNGPDPVYAGTLSQIHLVLQDNGASALDSDSLPRFPPPLEVWPIHVVVIYGDGFSWDIEAEIISMSLRSVTSVKPDIAVQSYLNVYPNPFKHSTTIEFRLEKPTTARFSVYNVLGNIVSTMELDDTHEGINIFHWKPISNQGSPLPSGIYFVAVEIERSTSTQKVLLLR
jgi:hypothetical protein